jgi:hypothetical protein
VPGEKDAGVDPGLPADSGSIGRDTAPDDAVFRESGHGILSESSSPFRRPRPDLDEAILE